MSNYMSAFLPFQNKMLAFQNFILSPLFLVFQFFYCVRFLTSYILRIRAIFNAFIFARKIVRPRLSNQMYVTHHNKMSGEHGIRSCGSGQGWIRIRFRESWIRIRGFRRFGFGPGSERVRPRSGFPRGMDPGPVLRECIKFFNFIGF